MVVTAVLAVLIAIWLPRLAGMRPPCGHPGFCGNNLKQIGLSFRQWALDNGDKLPMRVSTNEGGTKELVASGNSCAIFEVLSNELNTPKILVCPDEPSPGRISATFFGRGPTPCPPGQLPLTKDHLSYFVGVDAASDVPQMILAGDDHLALGNRELGAGLVDLGTNNSLAWTSRRHKGQGFILLADGSVLNLNSAQLRASFAATGAVTNRVAMPGPPKVVGRNVRGHRTWWCQPCR